MAMSGPRTCRAFVVAGSSSGTGKTTVALGLLAALRARGLMVQPFKCGPDFIDPGHHTRVCRRPSRNLDTWMVSDEANRRAFHRHAATADVSVIEGPDLAISFGQHVLAYRQAGRTRTSPS